jgi:hypothetical protein
MELNFSHQTLFIITLCSFIVVYMIHLFVELNENKLRSIILLVILSGLLFLLVYEVIWWFAIPNINYYELNH